MKFWKYLSRGFAAVKAVLEWHEKCVLPDGDVGPEDAAALVRAMATIFNFNVNIKV